MMSGRKLGPESSLAILRVRSIRAIDAHPAIDALHQPNDPQNPGHAGLSNVPSMADDSPLPSVLIALAMAVNRAEFVRDI
jgi:hypothetical protein